MADEINPNKKKGINPLKLSKNMEVNLYNGSNGCVPGGKTDIYKILLTHSLC